MKQIGTEVMSDWPIYAYTLREILKELGFEEDDKTFTLIKNEESNVLLDSYPITLEDDGMGYGVNPMFITEISSEVYKNKHELNVFNLFRNAYRNNENNILD